MRCKCRCRVNLGRSHQFRASTLRMACSLPDIARSKGDQTTLTLSYTLANRAIYIQGTQSAMDRDKYHPSILTISTERVPFAQVPFKATGLTCHY